MLSRVLKLTAVGDIRYILTVVMFIYNIFIDNLLTTDGHHHGE